MGRTSKVYWYSERERVDHVLLKPGLLDRLYFISSFLGYDYDKAEVEWLCRELLVEALRTETRVSSGCFIAKFGDGSPLSLTVRQIFLTVSDVDNSFHWTSPVDYKQKEIDQ